MMAKPMEDWDDFLGAMSGMYPWKWDRPKIDPDFAAAGNMTEERRNLPRRHPPAGAWPRRSLAGQHAFAVESYPGTL